MMRTLTLSVLILISVGQAVSAQQTRSELIAAAEVEFETSEIIRLTATALDPDLGPVDASWRTGAQLLVQTILDMGRPALARTWMRWVARHDQALTVDTLRYFPEVLTVYSEALTFVRNEAPTDTLVDVSWLWSDVVSQDVGAISMESVRVPSASVQVIGQGLLVAGEAITGLQPGTYNFEVLASGYQAIRFSSEVLPGVTTTVSVLDLRPEFVAAAEPVSVPEEPQIAAAGGGFPAIAIVGIIGAAGGALALLLVGGGDDPGQTGQQTGPGTIIVPFPTIP